MGFVSQQGHKCVNSTGLINGASHPDCFILLSDAWRDGNQTTRTRLITSPPYRPLHTQCSTELCSREIRDGPWPGYLIFFFLIDVK